MNKYPSKSDLRSLPTMATIGLSLFLVSACASKDYQQEVVNAHYHGAYNAVYDKQGCGEQTVTHVLVINEGEEGYQRTPEMHSSCQPIEEDQEAGKTYSSEIVFRQEPEWKH